MSAMAGQFSQYELERHGNLAHEAADRRADDEVARAEQAKRIEEFGRIILAYSEVTEKLQQSHERLERTVDTLRLELTEKNQLLERKNRLAALGEMAAGMAHEIRNPLGGIQLYASLLAKDVADRPASLTVVQKIAGGVRRLESLVSQILQFTREMKANCSEADLAVIVSEAVEYASAGFGQRKIDVHVDGPVSMPVRVDALLLGQAVLNLLLNASEAMDDGGQIRIRYSCPPEGTQGRQFHLVVEDDGPGIPSHILERIFDPFFTTKDTGTGLGLAIVHRVIEAHDGSIVVTNLEGRGAKFEIRI